MINSELLAYIRAERAKGTAEDVIRKNLIANGWTDIDVDQGLQASASFKADTIPTPQAGNDAILKKKKRELFWSAFITMVLFDAILIVMYKMFAGTYGLFGVTPVSVLVRLLVIFMISYFVANSTTESDKRSIPMMILRILGGIVVGILVTVGFLCASCLALFSLGGAL